MSRSQQNLVKDTPRMGQKDTEASTKCYEHRRFNNELCPGPNDIQGFKEFMDDFY
jgi:hypothetical protein